MLAKSKSLLTFPNQNNDSFTDHYELKEQIGSGAFSVVHVAVHKKSKQSFAVKIVNKAATRREEMYSELASMSRLNHPNIVHYKEIFDSKKVFYVVIELITGGELFDRIIALKHYSEKAAASVMKQSLEGLREMHDKNIIHRDLKPENLLLSTKNDDAIVKIADFGFALQCTEDNLTEFLGTIPYMAPELVILRTRTIKSQYGKGVDIWSMGVILYILLSGVHPFQLKDEDRMLKNIAEGRWSFVGEHWPKLSECSKNLVQKMLEPDPKKRYTVHDCLDHPWFHGGSTEDSLEDIAIKIKEYQAKKKA